MFGPSDAPTRTPIREQASELALDSQVVLGVDPGLTRCGFAVLRHRSAQDMQILSMGTIRTAAARPLPERLNEIRVEIDDLIRQFGPASVAVEQVFFQTNVRTAMSVGQASGVVLAVAAGLGCRVVQYSPSQVKSTVAGWGGATKDQIGRMIQQRFGLTAVPSPADVADAIAIALCHCTVQPFVALRDAALAEAEGGSR